MNKEAIAKREEKLEGLIREAEASPAIIAVRAQQAAETMAKRQEAARKVEMFRNEEAATIPKLEAVRATKEKIYLAAKAAMQVASDEFQAAHAALSIERSQFTNEIRRHEQVLIDTAPAEIGEAILFFRGKLDYFRSPGRISRNAIGSERNLISWKKKTFEESNAQAVRDAMRYCQGAITTLESWKLLPELDASKVEEMKKNVPQIDVYAAYTGEKAMEKGPAPSVYVPRIRDAAAEAIDALIQKANVLLSKPAPPKPATPKPAPPKLGKRVIQRINGRMVDIGPAKD
jgi:hypothetical protein